MKNGNPKVYERNILLTREKWPAGIAEKISSKELKTINITPSDFHGEWNYTIHPNIQNI